MCSDKGTPSLPPIPELKTTEFASNGQLLVEETEELIKASVAAVRADLETTPAWSGAPTPTDDFLLMFLRSEVFSPERAANRYRKFWQVKVSLFGEEEAPLPLKAMTEHRALNTQFLQVVSGSKDREGRQVVLADVGNGGKTLDRAERVRAVWYMLLAALEDVETQRRGICFIALLQRGKFATFDPKLNKMIMEGIQGALPVRVGSINLCYPPAFFRIAWAIVHNFMSQRVKERIRVISGTNEQVLEALSVVMKPTDVPPPMGTQKLDFASWLAERIKSER